MSVRYGFPKRFSELKIGEAFDVPIDSVPSVATVNMACRQNGKRLGRKFEYRTIASEGVYEVSRVDPNVTPTMSHIKPARPKERTVSTMTQREIEDELRHAQASLLGR